MAREEKLREAERRLEQAYFEIATIYETPFALPMNEVVRGFIGAVDTTLRPALNNWFETYGFPDRV